MDADATGVDRVVSDNERPKIHKYDYRHRKCNRLLFRGYLSPGSIIQIRCPKCGGMVAYKSDIDNPSRVAILIEN